MLRLLLHCTHRIHHPLRHITIDLRILIDRCDRHIIISHIVINQVDATQPMALVVAFLEIPLRYCPKK